MPRVSRLPREAEALASADLPALAAHVSAPVLLLPGEPGGRFIYLSWGTVDGTAGFTLFRRAKLWLGAVPADVLDQALDLGMLVGRLGLTDPKGNPLCAAVRPPVIDWSAAAHSG